MVRCDAGVCSTSRQGAAAGGGVDDCAAVVFAFAVMECIRCDQCCSALLRDSICITISGLPSPSTKIAWSGGWCCCWDVEVLLSAVVTVSAGVELLLVGVVVEGDCAGDDVWGSSVVAGDDSITAVLVGSVVVGAVDSVVVVVDGGVDRHVLSSCTCLRTMEKLCSHWGRGT